MKRVCTLCERTSPDGNLWCQQVDCPAEDMPILFSYGQYVGDVKVNRLLKVLRTSSIYEAERDETLVLLKVAHQGLQNQLRREASILSQLQRNSSNPGHPGLPFLLPAYQQSTVGRHSYGKAVIEGESVYFEVFRHFEGEFLRDILLKNSQPWYEAVAWLTQSLGDTIAYLNNLGRLHLNLSPEMILVRTDLEGIYRPVMLDLGLMIDKTEQEHLEWLHFYALPAYVAPELTYTTADTMAQCLPASSASDVYGLAILLYEMLEGHPVHEYKLRRESDVREAVRTHNPPALTRRDLPDEVQVVIERALSKSPRERYADVASFVADLRRFFGPVPKEKKRMPANQRLLIGLVAGAVVLSALILVASFLG